MADYPWFKSYDPGVPHSLKPYPDKTWLDVIAETTREMPDHTFMIFKGRHYSYTEASRLFEVMASALRAIGVKKGDCVATMLLNTPQQLIAAFGSMSAGVVYVPLNPLMNEEELVHALNVVDAEVIIVWDFLYSVIKKIQSRTKLRVVIATSLEDYGPSEAKKAHGVELQKGDLWFDELMASHASDPAVKVKLRANDTASVFFSGGTTGVPKGAMLSFGNLTAVGLQLAAWNGDGAMTPDDIVMALMPLFHVYGFNGIIGGALGWKSPIVIVPNPRDIDDVLDIIQKIRPAYMPGVPTIFNGIMAHPRVKAGEIDFKCLKVCLSSSTPMMKETKQRFEGMTGAPISEAYGMTEVTVVLTAGPFKGEWKEGSVGLPLPDVVIKFVDVLDPDKELPYGQEGEVVATGPQIMQGYRKNAEETAAMIKDGWLFTGDIGYTDSEGYLFLTSRKKELIKPSGHQVWPKEIEEIIATHPAVSEVTVAGIPDPIQTEAVKAWVVLKEGMTVSAEELQKLCRSKLSSYKIPKFIEFRQALPKTMVGKVLRRVLQEEEKARASETKQ